MSILSPRPVCQWFGLCVAASVGLMVPVPPVSAQSEAIAEDFAIVADSPTRAAELAHRIGQSHSVAVLSISDAAALRPQALAAYRVVWLLGGGGDAISDASREAWRKLTVPGGILTGFVRSGRVLVVSAPDVSAVALASPNGSYFAPDDGSTLLSNKIQRPQHPLVTGEGFAGVPLVDVDFNATAGSGWWLGAHNADVICSDGSRTTVAEVVEGSGHILLVGIPTAAASNLTGNLIGFARHLVP